MSHKTFVLWDQHQIASGKTPDELVFEGDPNKVAALAANDRRFHCTVRGAVRVFEQWRTYKLLMNIPDNPTVASVFVHKRQSAGGTIRIVAIELRAGSQGGFTFMVSSIIPETIFGRSAIAYQWILSDRIPELKFLNVASYYPGALQIFAGQPDGNDPSHFTIGIMLLGVPGELEGWLSDDGTVSLRLKDPELLRLRIDKSRVDAGWRPIINAFPWTNCVRSANRIFNLLI